MPRRAIRPGRRLVAALAATTLAVTGAGCGGAEVPVEEVPGSPPELPLPGGARGGAAAAGADAEATPTATPTPTTTATPTPGASGEATPEAGAASAGAGASGSDDPDYERFCAENPGAC